MGLAGFGKGLAEGYDKGNQMMEQKRKRVQSRGADGATGAGAANEPAKKVKNLDGSRKVGTATAPQGWHFGGKPEEQ